MTWVNTERTYVQNQDDSDATNSVISVCDITIRYYGCTVMVSNVEKLIAASVKDTLNKDMNSGKLKIGWKQHFILYRNTKISKRTKKVNQEERCVALFS